MNELKPMLFSSMKDYSKEKLIKDIIAGIIVAIIALPLSIALALASGVGPEEGLYTAIVAGFIISFLGGSTVQIAGPTAAFATIVAGIVAKNGMDGLMLATVMAGVFLILMGVFKLGSLIKYIPYTITTGFTAGIAVTIFIGQLKDFFGIVYSGGEAPIETMEKLEVFTKYLSTVNFQAVIVGLVSLGILIVWPYINKKIPGSLIAVLAGICMVKFFNMSVFTIGDLYSVKSSLPTFHMPQFSLKMVQDLLPDAFTIAILAAIESLLSCVVADGMTNTKHRSNAELVAQGVGNMGSALFGGIPATGAIARTAANIKNGGNSPIAGIIHAVVLLLVLVLLMPYASMIPMPTIAAILFIVAYNMCQWRPFVHLVKTAPKSDIAVLVITFILTVVFDLVIAIEVGFVLACLLFMKRMSDETGIVGWKYIEEEKDDCEKLKVLPKGIRVFEITGPLFFGASDALAKITFNEDCKCIILRMRSVPSLDVTAMNALQALYERCSEEGIKLVFSHVNDQPMYVMQKAHFTEKVGRENFCEHIDDAITQAQSFI
ncbi:MAG: STAS domain-containing protein [Clostridia bacterium]|nr:STAS domain-containing protein [Clostridia bacterium]